MNIPISNLIDSLQLKISPVQEAGGVYILYDNEDIVYIGESNQIAVRLLSHSNKKYTHYKVIYGAVGDIEKILISEYLPKYNNLLYDKNLKRYYRPKKDRINLLDTNNIKI